MTVNAYPLTPMREDRVDEPALTRMLEHLSTSDVAGVTVLGSTGNFAYLDRDQRRHIVEIAASTCTKPLTAGVSAVSTRAAIEHATDAQAAGADALLLAPVSYQRLTTAEVIQHYVDVATSTDLPITVYDNPTTTGFVFDVTTYQALAEIPAVRGFKTPAATNPRHTLDELRRALPDGTVIGTSGDATAPAHLAEGFDVWHSVIAGCFPEVATELLKNPAAVTAFEPLWQANVRYGSLRVLATLAEMLELTAPNCLPRPLQTVDARGREQLSPVLSLLRAPHPQSGDGWVTGSDGRRYWGKYGAAGLLVVDTSRDAVLLQHRAPWSHEGDTWGIPGGARDGDETTYEAALREAHEEANVPADKLTPIHEHVVDLGFWSYTTFVVVTSDPFDPVANDTESSALEWVPLDAVSTLSLHPGFAAAWPNLVAAIDAYRRDDLAAGDNPT